MASSVSALEWHGLNFDPTVTTGETAREGRIHQIEMCVGESGAQYFSVRFIDGTTKTAGSKDSCASLCTCKKETFNGDCINKVKVGTGLGFVQYVELWRSDSNVASVTLGLKGGFY